VRYGVHTVFGPLPDMTLTFDLLARKSDHNMYTPKYICDQKWVKIP